MEKPEFHPRGADPWAKMAKTGWSPAHVAAKHNNEALVAILTDGGKDLDLLQREKA